MYTLMLEHDPDIFDILLMACKSQDAAQWEMAYTRHEYRRQGMSGAAWKLPTLKTSPQQGLGLYALDWRRLSGYHSLQLSISASSQQNFAGEELAHGRNYTALSVSAEPTLFLLAMWSEVSLASPTPAGALHWCKGELQLFHVEGNSAKILRGFWILLN